MPKSKNVTPKELPIKELSTKDVLIFMLKTAWQNKPSLYGIYALKLCADVLQKMQLIILPKFILDELMLIISGKPLESHLHNVIFYVALTCIFMILTNLLTSTAEQTKSVLGEWFNEFFEEELARHAMEMDFEHTEDPDALAQLNKAKEGISWYSGGVIGILDCFYNIIMNIMVLVGVVTIIIMTCPLLLPIQLISLILITHFNHKNNKINAEGFLSLAKSNRIFGYVFYQLADFNLGKDIRLYNSADMMCTKAEWHTNEQINIWASTQKRQCKNSWYMDLTNSLRDGLSYFYIGYLALTKVISVGDFSMCVTSASTLYWNISGIVTSSQDAIKRCKYAGEFLKFLHYPAALPKGSLKVLDTPHTIEFSHVSFKYPRSEKFILRDLNLKINSGEHLSIVGLNGAGKTTLIKLLCRLYDVTEGEILMDGINIKDYTPEEYHKLFAIVFQDFKLFAFSLRENITLGHESNDEEVNEVLKLSGLKEDAQELEYGLDTMLYKSFDEHGTELSGGQQQKTAISRTLYKDAPIVILDEPPAALDPVAEYEIYRKFNTLVGGKTAIYISHRLSSCKFCDRIAVFANDTLTEYGTHDELILKENGVYAEMFNTQAQYYTQPVNCY